MPHTHCPCVSCTVHATAAGGLSPDALAAAIAVPVAVVLAALILACCCIRRRNLRRHKAAAAAAQQERDKDLEVGPLDPAYSADIGRVQDQLGRESQVCALEAAQRSMAVCLSCTLAGTGVGLAHTHLCVAPSASRLPALTSPSNVSLVHNQTTLSVEAGLWM